MGLELSADGAELRLNGPNYVEVLAAAHRALAPRRYFEIGTFAGDTLALARCRTVAVDPDFRLDPSFQRRAEVALYEQTSDAFFAEHDLTACLGGPVDLAFLDGMHQFDFLLRDFIACERHCRAGAAIFMHDCLPGHAFMARPHAEVMDAGPADFPGWCGDVWKIVPALRVHRPDLTITCLDAAPTGLVVVTGLDPLSRVLARDSEAIVADWSGRRLADWGLRRLIEEANVREASVWVQALQLGSSNWLTRAVRRLPRGLLRTDLQRGSGPEF